MTEISRHFTRRLILLWLGWIVILILFQYIADFRMDFQRPDVVLPWTVYATTTNCQPLVDCPSFDHQSSWDSNIYLSIAEFGYADPDSGSMDFEGEKLSINYAFFPFYPFVMATLSPLLTNLGMDTRLALTAAGIGISVLGTLIASLAISDLTRDNLDEEGRFRLAFYILIFPTAFYLSAVYTEGLYLGLVLSAFAMLKRKQFLVAGLLAIFATWTRATGILLVIPFMISWIQSFGWLMFWTPRKWFTWDVIIRTLMILAPVIAYFIWRIALGEKFDIVEEQFFQHSLFTPERTLEGWKNQIEMILHGQNSATQIYYLLEYASLGLAVIASFATLKRYKEIAVFSLVTVFLFTLASAPQSFIRYILTVPSVFLFLAHLGENELFDKLWSLFSILMLSLLVMLFSVGFWVA